MDVTANCKDRECRNPTMKKIDPSTVLKASFRDEPQSSLCKIAFPFAELQNILVEQLYLCVEFLWKSERYELIADVNKPIIAVFEKQRDFKVGVLNPRVSSNILHYIGELLTTSKSRNSLFLMSASSSQNPSLLVSEIIRSLLRHSSVVSESCRGGEFREAALRSLLSCGILWAGKFPTSSMASKFC